MLQVRWLLAAIDGQYVQLSKRLGTDTEKQQETERIERNAKRARIRARKEAEEAAAAALAAATVATAHEVLDVMDGTRGPSCLPGGLEEDPAFAGAVETSLRIVDCLCASFSWRHSLNRSSHGPC